MTVTMKVAEITDKDYILTSHGQDALLDFAEANRDLKLNENVEVFLYSDRKGKIKATTPPAIQIGQYGWADVVEIVPQLGVFVDIGIKKEMLVSTDHLPAYKQVWPVQGNKLFVKLDKDKKGRLLAIPATEDVLSGEFEWAPDDLHNKPVSGRIYYTSREGSALITEEDYRGFIHHTERKQEPRLGDLVHGRVINVKEDGTLNISLRPYKKESMKEDAAIILDHLKQNGGVIPFHDKSDPEDIRGTFQISKAAFKRALGKLMKEGKIEQRDGKTYLT